jgi:hypothetical protein
MNKMREQFEEALKTNPDARFWNTTDAMFWAWQAALSQPAAVEGWRLVPEEILKRIYMLIDPPPIEADGKLMVFKNPKAAETLTKLSAEIRALLAAPTPPSAPVQQSVISFAQEIMNIWPHGDVDGGELQDIAEKHGLLTPETFYEPCQESGCNCAGMWSREEWEAGVTCYRKKILVDPLSTSPLLDKNDQTEGEKLEWEDYEKIRDFREVDFAINNFHLNCTADNATEMVKAIVENTRNYPQPPRPDSNELVELRRDAERYRWIRNNAGFNLGNDYNIGNFQVSQKIKNGEAWYYYEEKLDEIIDAALAQSPSVGLNTKKGDE